MYFLSFLPFYNPWKDVQQQSHEHGNSAENEKVADEDCVRDEEDVLLVINLKGLDA